jgi:serine/threonine protein kinase/WD40 repeat protein
MAHDEDSPEVLRVVAMLERVAALDSRLGALALRITSAERAIRSAEERIATAKLAADLLAHDAAGKALKTAEKALVLATTERARYERERTDLQATLARVAQSNLSMLERARKIVAPSPVPEAQEALKQGTAQLPDGKKVDAGKGSLDSPDFPPDWDLYEPRALLGEGGMGRVYRVFHRGWGIDLAVKVPRKSVLDPKAMRAVVREAEAWSCLGLHPFVTSCYYARVRDGVPWLFAEFVDGGSVQQAIKSGSLYTHDALERMLTISIQSARGLHHAHERSVVHQDVKPANILLTSDGIAKVTDFGLARAALAPGTQGPRPTVEGTMIVRFSGMTPAYASPEQLASARGNEHAITRRTDVYSWAASVLEMFVGALTWISGPAAIDALVSLNDSGPRQPNVPKIPQELSALLECCFALKQSERPATMKVVADEVVQIYRKYCGGFLRDTTQLRQPPADAIYNRGASKLDLGEVDRALELWRQALYADPIHPHSVFAKSLIEWRQGKISDDHALRSLKEASASSEPSWENAHLLALLHAERGSVQDARSAIIEVARLGAASKDAMAAVGRLSPSLKDLLRWDGELQTFGTIEQLALNATGSLIAVLSGTDTESKLQVFAYDTRKCVAEFAVSPRAITVGFVDDWITLVYGNHIIRCNFADKSVEQEPSLRCTSALLTPIGALSTEGSTLSLLDRTTPARARWSMVLSSPVVALAANRRSSFAAACCEDGHLLVLSLEEGKVLWKHRYERAAERLAFSVEGQSLFVGGWDEHGSLGDVRVHDAISGVIHHEIRGPAAPVAMIATGDGRWLLHLSGTGVLRVWSLEESRWSRTERSAQGPGRFRQLAGAAQSGRIAIARQNHVALASCADRVVRAAIPLVCPTRSEEVFSREQQVGAELALVREATARRAWAEAIAALERAQKVEGYSHSPAVRRSWEHLALRTERGPLKDAWSGLSFECPSGAAHTVELSPDGSILYVVDGRNQLLALNSRSGAVIHRLVFAEKIHTFQVSPSSGVVVVAWGSQLEWLDPVTAQREFCTSTRMECRRIAVSADGHSVVLVGAEGFEAHRVVNGTDSVRHFAAKIAHRAAWLGDDGLLVLSADGGDLSMVSFDTGALVARVDNSAFAMDVVCSSDGQFMCAGHRDGSIRLWKIAHPYAGAPPAPTLIAECASDAVISGVSVSQDGKVVVSVDATGRVQAWDMTARRAVVLGGHETFVHDVALTPHGSVAATGGRDGIARVLWLRWELLAPAQVGWTPKCEQVLGRFVRQGFHKTTHATRLLALNLLNAGCGTVSTQDIRSKLSAVASRDNKA